MSRRLTPKALDALSRFLRGEALDLMPSSLRPHVTWGFSYGTTTLTFRYHVQVGIHQEILVSGGTTNTDLKFAAIQVDARDLDAVGKALRGVFAKRAPALIERIELNRIVAGLPAFVDNHSGHSGDVSLAVDLKGPGELQVVADAIREVMRRREPPSNENSSLPHWKRI